MTLSFLFLVLTSFAHAIQFEVIGKNDESLLSVQREIDVQKSLGSATSVILQENQIQFVGGEQGIAEMFGFGNEIEVISDTEMKAHGWCFAINGEVPESMADKTAIPDQSSIVRWYYAYAHYKDGQWIGQCVKN